MRIALVAPLALATLTALAGCGSARSQFERAMNRELDRLHEQELAVQREIERQTEAEEASAREREAARAREEAKARAEIDAREAAGERERAAEAEAKRRAAAENEDEAVAEMRRALESAKASDLDGAAAHASKAVELRPGFIDPLMLLAAIAEQRGDAEGARTRYLEVLRNDPTDVAAGNSIGFTYLAEGRFEVAREWFGKSIAADPGFEAAAYNLGSVAEQERDLERAVAWFEVSAALDRRDPRSLARIGQIRLAQGRPQDALQAAETALARYPQSQSAARVRAAALRALGTAPR